MKIKLSFFVFVMFFALLRSTYSYEISSNTPWINFTDLKNIIALSVDNTKSIAYCGTSGGLFVVNLNNGNILKKFTNIEGLISTDITAMIIDNFGKLWIGASDGSISILNYNNSSWNYIYDIKNSNEPNKIIYGFTISDGYIYVATGFGIEKVSTTTLNFVDAPYYQLGTLPTRTRVNTLTIENNSIFAGTTSGIAYASLNSNLNLPSNWTNYTTHPMEVNVSVIKSFDNKVFAGSDSGFAYFDNQNWNILSYTTTTAISPVGNNLFFISAGSIYFSNKDSLQIVHPYYVGGYSFNTLASDPNNNPLIGLYENGLLMKINNINTAVFPNCPNRNSFYSINFDDRGIFWAAGGLGDAGYYSYDGNFWKSYLNPNNPSGSSDFRKVVSMNNYIWAFNFGNGVFLTYNDTTINYNPSNSLYPLPGIPGAPNFCVPVGGAYDNNGLLWCTFFNTNLSKSLYVNTGRPDTAWYGYYNNWGSNIPSFNNVVIDNYNTKWISAANQQGLYFFNENNTLYDPQDDIYGRYQINAFSVNDVTDVKIDKNNTVWVATNNGVFIIDNPLGAIENPSNPPAPQKIGIISGNLKVPFTQNCTAIAVDVLNQKWIGTGNNGIFHLSDDGSTLIEQFNTTNSPILSNVIQSIAIDSRTGRAYFATNKGLSTVQTNAVQPVADFDKITCSPNPYLVPPRVDMKIDGLVENSSIKIISLTGDIVAEFTTPGGRIATWNGKDKRGNYAPSGIYIVVAYNSDGSKVGKGKVAIIRR